MCELGPGNMVLIKGLKARPELNSLSGTITGFSGEERFAVHVPEVDTKVALKAANLELIEEVAPTSTCPASREYIVCDACDKPGPLTTCRRCTIAFYCGAQCQRAHWRTHEADCRPIDGMRRSQDLWVASPDPRTDPGTDPGTDADVECGICLERVTRPVALPCGHRFCYECIKQYKTIAPQNMAVASCPYCRSQLPDLHDTMLSRAALLASRGAVTSANTWDIALAEVQKILDEEPAHMPANMLRAEILLKKGEATAALAAIELTLRENEAGSQHKRDMDQMMARLQGEMLREDDGEFDPESEEMQQLDREIEALSAKKNQRLSQRDLVEVMLKKATAHQALAQWQEAVEVYRAIMKQMERPEDGTPVQQRAVFGGVSKCLYHMGVYDGAIEMGNAAVEMNRHYPGCHEWIAKAERKQGDLNAAIRTMSRAALYETPWDDENVQVQRAHLAELIAERDAEREGGEQPAELS